MFALVAVLLSSAPPQAELVWIRDAGAKACDESALRQAVATRLGYDPFVPAAPVRVVVELQTTSEVTARVHVIRLGSPPALRVLTGDPDCQALTGAMALALALAIDPLLLTRPTPVPEPAPPAPVATPAPVPPPAPIPPPAPVPIPSDVHVWLTAGAGIDLNNQPAGLFTAQIGARVGSRITGNLAAWLTFPSHLALAGNGSVDATSAGGNLSVCVRFSFFGGCLAGRAGALRFDARNLLDAQRGWLPTVALGPRITFELPRESAIAIYVTAELWVPLVRTRMFVGTTAVWEQPSLGGSLLIGAAFRAG